MFTAVVVDAITRLLNIGITIPFDSEILEQSMHNASTPKHVCVKYLLHFGLDANKIAYACQVTPAYVRLIRRTSNIVPIRERYKKIIAFEIINGVSSRASKA